MRRAVWPVGLRRTGGEGRVGGDILVYFFELTNSDRLVGLFVCVLRTLPFTNQIRINLYKCYNGKGW